MKKFILLLMIIFSGINKIMSQAIGTWNVYPALQISTANVNTGDKVFSLCNGNLFCYIPETDEIYVYDRLNGLNDSHIKFLKYSETVKKVIVIYENGNIDLIYPDNTIINLSQLKDKNYNNLVINNLCVVDDKAFVCTNFGIVNIDIDNEIFTETYNIEKSVLSCTTDNEYIYMSCQDGGYKGKTGDNLLDKNNWNKVGSIYYNELVFLGNTIYGLRLKDGLFSVDKTQMGPNRIASGDFTYFYKAENKIISGNTSNTYIIEEGNKITNIKQETDFQFLSLRNNKYWASMGLKGLQEYKLNDNVWTPAGSVIQPNSPVRDYFCNMHYAGNRLLVAGGQQNYNMIVYPGTAMYYENGKWTNFQEEGITETTGLKYIDLTSMAQDPEDSNHHYVGSARQGLYEFMEGKFIKKYDHTNSGLDSIYIPNAVYNPKDYVSVGCMKYDNNGNLWMMNNEVDTIIKIKTKDDKWIALYYPEIEMAPTCDQIHFDKKGRMWAVSRRMSQKGIFFLDYNNTINTVSDDIHIKRDIITNQDGVKYEPNNFFCIAEDHNGELFIGTDIGLFVISEPDKFANDNFEFTQIKIPRNDGSNLADYLLNGVSVTCIAVDAANRKWIGTSSNGVYLISADGMEMIHNFTSDNSPLLSNSIQSIAIDPQNGEVMIGTTSGLISYVSDAAPGKDDLIKDNVYAYPNPVKPEYNGIITVTGLTNNAEVKIVTTGGQLVYSGYSNGSIFTWNGNDSKGNRVSSGIYHVISNTSDGKKAVVTRIAFIK